MGAAASVVCLQLGVKALTYSDLIQAQKEISAHNQQLREQTEQLDKDNRELRTQSLQLVRVGGPGPSLYPALFSKCCHFPCLSELKRGPGPAGGSFDYCRTY